MRNLFFSIFFIFIAGHCFSQQIDFFDNLSSSVGSPVFLGSYTDNDLNLYVTGQVAGTTLHLFNYTYGTPFSGSYTFLVKFNPAHQVVWFRYFQCYGGATKMHGLIADDDGNVYFSVEHGNTNAPIDSYTSDGTFIIKLDQYGVIQWFKPYYADNLRLISNNRIQLIGASNDNDLIEGTFAITNPSGTVITLDTAGVYQSHFMMDHPSYQSERIIGTNNQNQFYGYRATNGTPTLVSAFLADTLGSIIYSKRINYCPSFALPFSMTYDATNEKYFVIGRFEVNVPMDTNVNVAPFGNQNAIMKLNNQFQIAGIMPLTAMNGNGGTAPSIAMHTYDGDLFIGSKLSSSSLTNTHLGPHYFLNFAINNLWMAKIDQNLQFKWCKLLESTYFAGRFSDIWTHDDNLAIAGNSSLIPGIPPPYNNFSGSDIFIGIIKDLDSTDINFAGRVFYDVNLNGFSDTGEPGIPSLSCVNTDTSGLAFTTSMGAYMLTGQPGYNLIRSLTIPTYWARSTPDSIVANVSSLDTNLYNMDFGIFPVPNIVDLRVVASDYHPTVLATSYPIKLDYYNLGTDTNDVEIKFILDSVLNYTGSSVTPTSISGDTLTWNIDTLHYFNEGSLIIYTSVPNDLLILTDSVVNYASITSLIADTVPYDNFDTLISIIVGPVDPNDKTSIPTTCFYEPFVQTNQSIEYKIRFQNTGTSPAVNVYIVDTLSSLLDPSTIQIIASSHDCYTIYEDGVLKFFFDNINLTDSGANYDASCGFVRFLIQPVNNILHGDVIGNSAEIYFDFNPPVYTGTTHLYYYQAPVTIQQQNPSCPQASDGTIQVMNWCSAMPTLYSSLNGINFDSLGLYNSLAMGSYDIYILNDDDTLLFSTINLIDPVAVTIDSVDVINNTCGEDNGSVQVFASGQLSGLSYSINGIGYSASSVFNNLPAGEYPVFVQDSAGCEYQWNDSINLFSIFDLAIDSIQVTPSLCNNDSSGAMQIFVHGEYDTVYFSINGIDYYPNSGFTNLFATNYQVVALDSLCYDTFNVVVSSLSNLNANVYYSNITSLPSNGSITVEPFDGLYPYSYSLNGGAFGSDSIFYDLDAGPFTITVMDSLGCTQDFNVTLYSTLFNQDLLDGEYFIYPNPTPSDLYVTGMNGEKIDYTIMNMYGQMVKMGVLDDTGRIDLVQLQAGTYFLKLNNKFLKFIKVE